MNERIITVVVLLLAMLNLVPPLFSETVYFDNIYFVILYFLLSFLGLSIPFLFEKLNKFIAKISFFCGSWFVAGLIYELINLTMPEIVLNSREDKTMFNFYLICFTIGLSFTITHKRWIKAKR